MLGQERDLQMSCKMENVENDEGAHYIGLAEGTFKERWYKHNHDFKNISKDKSTELPGHVWILKR